MNVSEYFLISPEVQAALVTKRAVVALESTIIAHGLPYPHNLATAQALEATVRKAGAVPATIAVLDGKICIGLTEAQLERLAKNAVTANENPNNEKHADIAKLSLRDIATTLVQRSSGATTVAATMWAANAVGIQVFATGGIGGVHRGASQSFDISADLQALATIPVAVVCAGAKAILDLPLTLQYLETFGVPVIGYNCKEFPAFYYQDSGLALQAFFSTATELALVMHTQWRLGLKTAITIANPIPKVNALAKQHIEAVIAEAIQTAEQKHIEGAALTPFLLTEIGRLSAGESLEANIALVRHNAQVAAEVALAYQRLQS